MDYIASNYVKICHLAYDLSTNMATETRGVWFGAGTTETSKGALGSIPTVATARFVDLTGCINLLFE